jgi:N-acetylglucosamine-6-sulfatase
LTGCYAHNTATFNNSRDGGCYSEQWIEQFESKTFPAILKDSGYQTFYAGKYLNQYDSKHVPRGYDEFYGLHGNSKYFNYTLNENGNIVKYGDGQDDYYTNVIKRQILNFLSKQTKDKPFIAIASTPSCHAPFTPEDKYKNSLSNLTAPRTRNFNVGANGLDKHWLMTMKPKKLSQATVEKIDEFYRMRLGE